ncbi:MAG: CheR family methyltransferase, partial [Thermomicrobiales bacterium]
NALGDYLTHLDQHPEEEERLVGSFLIKVTRFFRDPALFARLRDKILPELVDAAQASGRELRFWSAGCATGEEAYSLALLLSDLLADRSNPPPVRIFATDLDDKALVFARRGIYSASALADVPPEMVERYFEAHEGSHQVRKAVRSLIVFGTHDLAQRAPFPQTDLVLCRNVLIYFTPKLQKRALEIFAYSLRDGGYLVLGSSEIPRPAERAFTDVDRRLRLYRRTGPRPAFPPMHLPVPADAAPGKPGSGSARNPSTLALALRQAEGETQVAQAAGGRAEDLVRRLPIGIAVVDRQYDIEMINGVARELLGIHGLAIGQDLIHLAQRVPSTALREAIDAIVRDGPPQKLLDVVTAETATGESRHIGISCYPDRHDPGGAVETVMVMVEDVTALTSARGDGAAAAQRVERLAQSNYQLLAANRELTDALDKLRELSDELRLSTAAAEVSAEEIETLNEELQSTNEELETLHEEAQATVEELSVANGELEARAVELEEVTDFQAGERARLEAVLTSMADAVVVVDHRGRAVRTNAAYDDLLGVLGASFVPLNECGTPLPSAAAPQARAARGETFRLDFTAIAEDGTQHWFEAIGRPLSDENAGVGVVVIHDITDRSVRRLQEEFLAWAGHEVRTPLTALQGFLQMAGRRVSAGPDGNTRLRASLDRAVEQSRRLASLIEELVDVTRLESGQFSFKTSALDLAELAAHAVEIAQVLAEEKAITLKVDGGPLVVAGDAGRLEQVVLNLLTNAIAYAPGADRIEVIARRDGEDSTLAVRDFGPGIDPARFSSLFDRFTRGQSDERPVSGGLGLGLFISREIVRAHGGEITVESEHDTGTTFTIRIPLSPNADA